MPTGYFKNVKGSDCLLRMDDTEMSLYGWKRFYWEDEHMKAVFTAMENTVFHCDVESPTGIIGILYRKHFDEIESKLFNIE